MTASYDYIFVNGREQPTVACTDRGLAYGDGVFETIRLNKGKITFSELHFVRLYRGCKILNIPLSKNQLAADINKILSKISKADGVLKIIITRGCGLGGYEPIATTLPNRVLLFKNLTEPRKNKTSKAAVLGLSKFSLYPSCVAEIKHLNRLVQVMASAECQENNYDELLLANEQGNIIEGICSNLFLVNNVGELITPKIYNYGVAGVCREWILQNKELLCLSVKLKDCTITDLQQAKEVFLCNSVFGIWPVTNFCNISYSSRSISMRIKDVIDNELYC